MNRMRNRYPTHTQYLNVADMARIFSFLDSNGSGHLTGEEVTEMFNTVCGRPVSVSNPDPSFDLRSFIRFVERVDTQYPQFGVSMNLMKYLKEQVAEEAIPPPDPDLLNSETCSKLFQFLDKDGTGELGFSEVIQLFLAAGVTDVQQILEADGEFGSITSAEELQAVVKKMDENNPQLDVDEKLAALLGSAEAAGGIPDPEETEDPPPAEPSNKKKALLIGINYVGTGSELGGCINDVRGQMDVLKEHFGYEDDNIMLLTEDQDDDSKLPTKANMIAGFEWLMDGAEAGDEIFFQYSGHGSQCPDRGGGEPDGKNECLCPLDCQDGPWPEHVILDNYIYKTFCEDLPDGVKCICIFDCCHSGTMADLSVCKEISFDMEEAPKARWLDPPEDCLEELAACEERDPGDAMAERAMGQAGEKLLWTFSGCQDHQTSADATIGGKRQGALTWGLLDALESLGYSQARYVDVLNATKKRLAGKFKQIPGLSTTSEANLRQFYMA
eukprot:CAMPEP_0176220004 /NCGR_PEP_ID=MMETSP0121_2-20121125/19000_1 /TAXON_ID=160619 /ORGANISM="Kryptoperidinium foliaceum, Strain CCMP 1326" /LENGTH=498 /DNA_ID=CAMNT_0017559183 /DNA_START=23 /DNA_END=1519 /DNA_ORIENTATION=-